MTLFLLADCWAHAFSYLDATSLARVALMCKHWRSLSDESVLWIHHCARLWKGKQNHYLERWVDISHIENVESIVDVEDARRGDLSYIQQQVRVLRQLHAAYSQNYDYLQMTAPNSQDSGAARQHLGRIHRALTDMVLLQTPVASGDAQRRMHMPVSQYYLSAVVRKETLLFNRLGKPDSVCEAGAQEEVSAALSAPLRITQQHVDALDAMGALLTWKQSYMASIRDSKRTWLTHTELRAQGEWLICFSPIVELCRFTSGGHQFIDNRAFFAGYCNILLHRDRIIFKEIRHSASAHRSAEDWGWLIEDDTVEVMLTSFDRRAGSQGYDGPLAVDEGTGSRRVVYPLVSPLATLNRDNGLFSVQPLEANLANCR